MSSDVPGSRHGKADNRVRSGFPFAQGAEPAEPPGPVGALEAEIWDDIHFRFT